NVIDLAVAVVIGGAFGKIVSSLANNIIMPLVGVAAGGVNFADMSVNVGEAIIDYGIFLQSIIDFTIVAIGIFIAIKILGSMQQKEEAKPESQKVVEPTEEVKLLREIRTHLENIANPKTDKN
ncbi:MAG: large conductance mechanosensitive channel protein MscL, partial [Candidatus Paceibacterota bacterium]